MFRAMLWKETREQAAILIALLALGSGVIFVAATVGSTTGLDAGLADFRAYTNAGRLAVLALTIAAGVVVGGSLFAGEIENETMTCLDMLPARRWTIWRYKLAAGAVMVTVGGAILLAIGSSLGALGATARTAWLMTAAVLTFIAFGWGAFGSAIARTTLAACAIGLLCAVLFGVPIFTVVLGILRYATQRLVDEPSDLWTRIEPLVAAYAVVAVPLLLAGLIVSAPDRARFRWMPNQTSAESERSVVSDAPGRLRALLWLARSQWLVSSLVGLVLALGFGLVALLEEAHLLVMWPMAACLAGVFGGVFAWTDEQSKETFRFWGERRLPLTAFWCAKVATSLAQTLFWVLLLFLPVIVRSLAGEQRGPRFARAFGTGILGDYSTDTLLYMLVWPVYGFAFGHLAGLLFRKTIVALGVGLLTAMPVLALWLPSLLTGGLHGWQLWPVPLLVLFSTRLLLRPWSADRIGTARPLGTLAAVGAACVAFTAFGLLWRAVEVPVTAQIDDDLTFAANVPQLDSDDGGRAFRSTIGSSYLQKLSEPSTYSPGRIRPDSNSFTVSREYLAQLARDRWPVGDLASLGHWLDSPEIVATALQLKKSATLPPGPIENPRVLYVNTVFRESMEIRPAVLMLAARGLWRQRQGDSGEFVECLEAALAIVRNARTQQPTVIHRMGMAGEASIFDAVDRWLEKVGERPDLIRMVLKSLQRHERVCPRDGRDAYLADRMIDRNTLNAIPIWAPKEIELGLTGRIDSQTGFGLTPAKQKAEIETELASLAAVVPWERERFRRIMGVRNADDRSRENLARVNSWFGMYLLRRTSSSLVDANALSETNLNLALAQTALALFALERGRPAKSLDELVPDYLPAVPVDLYAKKPLGYRVSTGERIEFGRHAEDPNNPLSNRNVWTESEFEARPAVSGVVGGFAFTDLPSGLGVGRNADGSPRISFDFIGAVAGGFMQFLVESAQDKPIGAYLSVPNGLPDESLKDPQPDLIESLKRNAGLTTGDPGIRLRKLVRGQGVVWSIGPDKNDGGGMSLVDSKRDNARNSGDLIRVVPFARPK